MATLLPEGKQSFTNSAGAPLIGGKLYTYDAGTSTPRATYQDAAGTVPNTNPIILDARGEATVFWSGNYKVVLKDAADVTIWSVDNVQDSSAVFAATLAASTGAGLIGWVRNAVGAVVTTVAKLLGWKTPHVFDFMTDAQIADVVSGAPVLDHTAAIQSAVTGCKYLDFGGPENSFRVAGVVTLVNGSRLVAGGASIKQVTANTEIFNIEGKTDIAITGISFVGVGTDYSDSDSSRSVAVFGSGAEARIKVNGNKFTNFSYTTLRAKGSTLVEFCNNVVVGPGYPTLTATTSGKCYGVLLDAGCNGILVQGNSITKTAQGVRIEQSSNARIVGNDIFGITGQHGVYAGAGLTNIVVADNTISDIDLIGIKFQAQNLLPHNFNISITGNTINVTRDQGILISNGAGSTAQAVINQQVSIVGNTVTGASGSGINVQNATGAVISGNVSANAAQSGISISACNHIVVDSNEVIGSNQPGIRDEAPNALFSITGNRITNCCASGLATDSGIYISDGSSVTISNNVISDANVKMRYGIWVPGGDQTGLIVNGNTVYNATEYSIRLKNGTDFMRSYRNNVFTGTLGPAFNDPALRPVASADALVLPVGYDVYLITGTTNITSIVANGHSGRIITLLFAGALTVVRGGVLLVSSNFVTTANDTLTLCSDGIGWFELARSAN